MFEYIFTALNESGRLQAFRAVNEQLLIALDGTQYHSSDTIHCEQCTVKHNRIGKTNYSHTVITPVIVSPEHRQVIPLEPDFITPQDGHQNRIVKQRLPGAGSTSMPAATNSWTSPCWETTFIVANRCVNAPLLAA